MNYIKYIINNIFIKYLKFWIFFFMLFIFYIFLSYFNKNIKTNKIATNILNGVFVGNGIVINDKDILVNKTLIDNNCSGIVTGKIGNIYVMAENIAHGVFIYATDKINNMTILRLKKYNDSIKNHAIFQIDSPSYSINRRLLVPFTKNHASQFVFKEIRITNVNNNHFFLATKNIFRKKEIIGSPLFSKNFLLQGIIKEINDNYTSKTFRDNLLNKLNIQEVYLANNLEIIKNFLNNHNIKYSMAGKNFQLNNSIYSPQKSVVNVICVKRY